MGALAATLRALIGEPLELPHAVVARWPELAGARWRRGGLPPRLGGWALGARTVAAIALGRTVFVAPGVPLEPALLLHEMRHVHQFQAIPAFALRYLWQSATRGYRANLYEADACRYAASRLRDAAPHREDVDPWSSTLPPRS